MNYTKWIGIDVSKDKLDISEYNGNQHLMFQISNTNKAILHYLRKFQPINQVHVIMEATGAYHMVLFSLLVKLDFPTSVVNPLIIKRYSQMKMLRAKTDQVDARLIAEYGFEQNPRLSKLPPEVQIKITSLFKAVRTYQKLISILKNNVHALTTSGLAEKSIVQSYNRSIRSHIMKIKRFEQLILEIVETHYKDLYIRLKIIPGVGPKTASMIIGFFGNFENFENVKQVVSYVGLNPNPRMSGKSVKKGSSISKKGNPLLRKILYLAALSAKQYNPECKEQYERLLNKGVPKVKAQIAVAHKLLRQIFAIVKYNRIWCPYYHKTI